MRNPPMPLLIALAIGALLSLAGCQQAPPPGSGQSDTRDQPPIATPAHSLPVEIKNTQAPDSNPPAPPTNPPAKRTVIHLTKVVEPHEAAFTYYVPVGWITEGGVIRVNPGSGPMNSIGAKVDFKIKRDPQGTVMLHFMPGVYYEDWRYMKGLPPPAGGRYAGMALSPVLDAVTFLQRGFVSLHPQASSVKMVDHQPLPELIQAHDQARAGTGMKYDAAVITMTYTENGVRFREKLYTSIEIPAPTSTGIWRNFETFRVRAPDAEFDQLTPLLALIKTSGKANANWQAGEARGEAQRTRNYRETQAYINQRLREILAHRRETYAENRRETYLFLTGQEDYINPYTHEVETGTNEWKYRWQSASGDLVYTDDPHYDPNWDTPNKHTDYQRSAVRPRSD